MKLADKVDMDEVFYEFENCPDQIVYCPLRTPFFFTLSSDTLHFLSALTETYSFHQMKLKLVGQLEYKVIQHILF